MAKRSTISKSSKQVKLEEASVRIRLLRNVKYKYKSLSGNILVWNGAGSEVNVDREDATILLAKTRTGGCAGCGYKTTRVFEEVK
jgi:hypothetical protein